MPLVIRRSLAGFCAAGAIVFAAGCGGGGDNACPNALSAGEFRTQADAYLPDVEGRPSPPSTSPPPRAPTRRSQPSSTAGLKASDAQIAKLRALDPPSDLAPTVRPGPRPPRAAADAHPRRRRPRGRRRGLRPRSSRRRTPRSTSLNDQADAKAQRAGPHRLRHGQRRLGHLGHDLDRNDGDRPHHDRRGDIRPGDERSQGGAGRPGGREHDPSGRERKPPSTT